jgi:TatD DNase family protein
MLIDTHAHLDFPNFKDDTVDNILTRAKAAGVSTVINVGADLQGSRDSVVLAQKYPDIYASVGIHPHDAAMVTTEVISELKSLAKGPKVVAVGEIGLDYFKYDGDRKVQQTVFEKQLALAKELELPVIIHDRDAHDDVLTILKQFLPLRGVMHCFSGDVDFAKKILDIGFLLSFTGNITFPKAEQLRKVVEFVPIEKIMVETDCPFLAPQAYRGQRNEPAYVLEVARMISSLKQLPIDEIADRTTRTAITFFNLYRQAGKIS